MSNVKAMRSEFVTPAQVIDTVVNEIGNITDIYVVTFEDGQAQIYASGNLTKMPAAALLLTDLATRVIKDPNGVISG